MRGLLMRVFGRGHAPGNPVAIVLDRAEDHDDVRQRLAAHLGVPDTGFLHAPADMRPGIDGELLTHSPVERLALCVTTLLAAGAVRCHLGRESPQPLRFSTESDTFTVHPDRDDGGLWWLDASVADALPPPDALVHALSDLDISMAGLANRPMWAGTGRRRLYLPLKTAADLDSFKVQPARADTWCRAHGITGLCPFVVCAPDRLALRVFTTSLNGAEDVATGGAVLGLLALERPFGLALADRVEVTQGPPGHQGQGHLLLRPARNCKSASLGGRVRIVLDGHLVLPHDREVA